MIKLAPSILSADFTRLGDEVRALERGGADYIHVDVMDGRFVPNITIGQPVVRALRKVTACPLDVHLMIEDPVRYAGEFREAGADIITVHIEALDGGLSRLFEDLRESGAKCGLSIKPGTPVQMLLPYLKVIDMALVMTVEPGFGGQELIRSTLPKIEFLRRAIDELNPACELQVDGGVKYDNVGETIKRGANVIVAGSAVFGSGDVESAVRGFKDRLSEYCSAQKKVCNEDPVRL